MESASEIKVKSEPVFDFGASQNESSGNGFRQEYSDSDDDIPLAQKLLKRKKQKSFKISSKDAHVDKKPKLANAVLITDNTSDSAKFGESEDDIPLSVLYKKHKVKKDPGISSSISSNDRISEENGIPKKAKKGEKTKSKKPSTSTKTTEPKKVSNLLRKFTTFIYVFRNFPLKRNRPIRRQELRKNRQKARRQSPRPVMMMMMMTAINGGRKKITMTVLNGTLYITMDRFSPQNTVLMESK